MPKHLTSIPTIGQLTESPPKIDPSLETWFQTLENEIL